ncbi:MULTISPECIES: lysophospholipid acyltransferase family protein [Marinobacter]|jgi:1-acyl-sn-glycerol-3-phosphate acyltransferase|uniref:1-acyl-sn-glycerol-3-phosphate acyltransferase n=2 Tax=Marinobacter salarius TaxID=1420917 RepID=A0A1W6K587_9GAMM|nr:MULTISPECIES: 1-acylglycerol-3-phosphate O-acyltransferase [Marinobacter]MBL83807.1 1-acyl-sn-glycerol-3-phosphate acyltransferase [Marinobacter sp.]ARM82593.1 1-acyl-sn-glycerol-3-phosphate acyltransferase [Marinobacter salarius]KXJ47181.1 MAG: acyl-phosphate glycerol 3-phosphate acyltransferase [Marinobacter sp. Hex_13]MBJ7276355.1 1-acylglycerol-3-phosphate O-acyltransferase [Marinobacter salarius]MCC4283343.1 1-acylglycerol-3-phosphate O-acyltransferase [Marinobacter salarius]|tara:strand:- start:1152 stop:1862 length:711 start_codon:yes stop_codon:yes gene_type:complete
MGMPRKLLAWLMVPVICLFALVLYVARPFNPDNNRLLARTIARVGRLLLGMERPLEGADNMPQDRPTVVIANHQHNDDLFVMGDLLPPRTVTVGKSSLIWIPFFGQVFWLGGNVILNRGRSHKAVAVMQATSEAISRDRKSLWVFPEGTRSRGRGLQSFKKGAFHAAIASGAPITMVCASQYYDRTLGWSGRREPVAIRVLPPVETAGLTVADIPQLMAQCRQQMEAAIADLEPTA